MQKIKYLMIFEKNIFRRNFSIQRNYEDGYEIRSNTIYTEYLLYNELDLVGIFKNQRLSWAGYVWRAESHLIHAIMK